MIESHTPEEYELARLQFENAMRRNVALENSLLVVLLITWLLRAYLKDKYSRKYYPLRYWGE